MAQILSNFYPLAGRYNKWIATIKALSSSLAGRYNKWIATTEALSSSLLKSTRISLILRSHMDPQQLNQLLPVHLAAADGPTDPILAVQINRFQCGGLAIAACASHSITETPPAADISAAAVEGGGGLHLPHPGPPPRRHRALRGAPSRLHRAAHQYSGKNCPARAKARFWHVAFRFFPRVRRRPHRGRRSRGEFSRLASRIREATFQGVSDCARVLGDKELGWKLLVGNFLDANKKAETEDCKVIWLTDFSKFGDYELDFGFGNSEWVSIATVPVTDHIIMLNNRSNDGIQAWVCLKESDMQFFGQDTEILLLSANTSD
ncbi:hypothetical protein SASPL_133384 [Salvia splendens]|uniref:Shikimate O-hydroxycinnamoyltransferase n=1 Tax=Salvia splendens TaxID=180675 RepID=A0A8X8X2V3_SALSN|nr:hypothetical protein SASPL_133384 [Salvia splendens]